MTCGPPLEEPGGDLPFEAVAAPDGLLRLLAARAGGKPTRAVVLAIPLDPGQEPEAIAARAQYYRKFTADFLAVAEPAAAPDG